MVEEMAVRRLFFEYFGFHLSVSFRIVEWVEEGGKPVWKKFSYL
jgi:hypothetical protein